MSELLLPRRQIAAYSLPMTCMFFMHGPVVGILPVIYAKYFGISLVTTATILLVSRWFDAFTDPLIGFLSDRTKTRLGRRKPWMIAGSTLSLLAVYYLFIPPESPSVAYYTFWSMLLFLAWTMNEIPYGAWGTELSRGYDERTRIFAFRAWFREVGTVLFLLTPLAMYYFDFAPTTEMTPDTLRVVCWGIMIILPSSIVIAVIWAPTGKKVSVTARFTMKDLMESLKVNKPLRMFIPIYVISGIAVGTYGAMSFLYLDSYLHIGDKYSYVHGVGIGGALLSYPIWLKIIRRFGKHRSWAVSNIVFGLGVFPIALIEPGAGAFIPYIALYLVGSVTQGAGSIIPPSVLSDVIDYDILKTGTNRAASYLSLTTLLIKANIAIGSALAFYIIALFGYDINAEQQTDMGALGVNIAALFVPGSLFAIAGIGIWFFPQDARRADIIRRRIESRAERQARDNPGGDGAIYGV
jgi:GPH family glycoside/pentoside/hexuronide:cation symporter